MSVIISPMPGVEFVDWNVYDSVPIGTVWNGRPVYYILYTQGAAEFYYQDFPISLTFEIPETATGPYNFDISLSAHFIHDERTRAPEFTDFTNAFPKWGNVQNWTTYYVAYQY